MNDQHQNDNQFKDFDYPNKKVEFFVSKTRDINGKQITVATTNGRLLFTAYSTLFFYILSYIFLIIYMSLKDDIEGSFNNFALDKNPMWESVSFNYTPFIIFVSFYSVLLPFIVYAIYRAHQSRVVKWPNYVICLMSLAFSIAWTVIYFWIEDYSKMLGTQDLSTKPIFDEWTNNGDADRPLIFTSFAFLWISTIMLMAEIMVRWKLPYPTLSSTNAAVNVDVEIVKGGTLHIKQSKTSFGISNIKPLMVASIILASLFVAIIGLNIAQLVLWNKFNDIAQSHFPGTLSFSSDYNPTILLIVSCVVVIPTILIFYVQSKRKKFDLWVYISVIVIYLILLGVCIACAHYFSDWKYLFWGFGANGFGSGFGSDYASALSFTNNSAELLSIKNLIYAEIAFIALSILIAIGSLIKTYKDNKNGMH